MEQEKQKTIKRHFFLVAVGMLGVLSLLSLTAPFDSAAPKMPGDQSHQSSQKVIECLNCHRNDGTAAPKESPPKPMRHEMRANCTFCHARP
jgi:cytochrome c553